MDQRVPEKQVEGIPADPGFAPRFEALRQACLHGPAGVAFEKLRALHAEADRFIEGLKRGLFRAPLAWNEEQKAANRWISLQYHRFARNSRRVVDRLAQQPDADGEQLTQATALGLHHMAEAMKCEMAEAAREPRHFASLHALMRPAIAGDWHRRDVTFQVQAREVTCTVESLYFRALLLARSAGVLTSQQVEILDSWLWMWMPELRSVTEMPDGPSLRADLDSNYGLRRRPRSGAGPSIYLPLLPLERAFRSILAQFQNGEIAPADGHASRFRLEEHMVVLDLARRALRGMRSAPVSRASRLPSSITVELHVGIAEIMSRAFAAPRPASMTAELVEHRAAGEVSPRPVRDNLIGSVYELDRRKVRVVDISASGIGLEGMRADCGGIAVGDVVALRLSPDGPVELGKVARRAAGSDASGVLIGVRRATASDEDHVRLGVRQLSAAVQRLSVSYASGASGARIEQMLYVPGEDASGRNDAFLVGESALADRRVFETEAGDATFSIRLNRVRDRGRGWLLAGFEICAMHKHVPEPLKLAA